MIRCQVSSAPAVVKGSGFTVADAGTGLCTVTFTVPFSDPPAVAVTVVSSGSRDGKLNAQPASGSCVVHTYNPLTGSSSDEPFNFIAIGPA